MTSGVTCLRLALSRSWPKLRPVARPAVAARAVACMMEGLAGTANDLTAMKSPCIVVWTGMATDTQSTCRKVGEVCANAAHVFAPQLLLPFFG
mmetsp:Transcript_51631/g.93018  ORF Transcript_51631/g.93018 Transcript_51631/m.93018 type:complete len:93 (-) Transcript_51631:602-880(-)